MICNCYMIRICTGLCRNTSIWSSQTILWDRRIGSHLLSKHCNCICCSNIFINVVYNINVVHLEVDGTSSKSNGITMWHCMCPSMCETCSVYTMWQRSSYQIQDNGTGLQGCQQNCPYLPPSISQTPRPSLSAPLNYLSWPAGTAIAKSKQRSHSKVTVTVERAP